MSVATVALSLSPRDTTGPNPPSASRFPARRDNPTPRHDPTEARLTGQAT